MLSVESPIQIGIIYLIITNVTSFCLFAWDKKRSRRGGRRIPERDLMLSAIMGGSLGGWLGMYTFRHKTRHLRFRIGIPLIFMLQVILIIYLAGGK